MINSSLVEASHLTRRAVIYIRQSSAHQVMWNVESRKLQEKMREQARSLGWADERIKVVDADTGLSARSAEQRQAYRDLLAEVALGNIGIVLSYESARLSRNCSDWYPLLDLCAMNDCLVADRDGLYDPASINGRILLGMKGILSEVELHTLKGRLTAGRVNKARRGELRFPLPTGLLWDELGTTVKDPDLQVQQAIQMVFSTFLERRSAFKVVTWFRDHGLKLPRRVRNDEIVWRQPSSAMILKILKNPAYAGAYVYGRGRPGPSGVTRSPGTGTARERMKEPVVIRDQLPAYVSWETYERIQALITDNYAEYKTRSSRGVTRKGRALLQGIAYCALCGRKLQVRYKASARYLCNSHQLNAARPLCQAIPMEPIDECVTQAFFEALRPAELDVLEQIAHTRSESEASVRKAQSQELERLKYAADLARRRYERTDPDNRLVAAELERRWEVALQELHQAQSTFGQLEQGRAKIIPLPLSRELRASFASLSEALPAVWEGERLTNAKRKSLLRCLIDKVVLARPPQRRDQVTVRVIWRGGAVTERDVPIPVANSADLSSFPEMEAEIIRLAEEGLDDAAIAAALTERDFRTALRDAPSVHTVKSIRVRHPRLHRRRASRKHVAGHLTIAELSDQLGVTPRWFYGRLRSGQIPLCRDPDTGLYLFPDQPHVVQALQRLQDGSVTCLDPADICRREVHQDA